MAVRKQKTTTFDPIVTAVTELHRDKKQKPTFFSLAHELHSRPELTELFSSVEGTSGLRDTVQLLPHQRVIIKAIGDIEDQRAFTVRTRDYDSITNSEVKVESSAVVLSEPFGTGKTIEILAHIARKPVPKAFPSHANSVLLATHVPQRKRWQKEDTHLFHTEIIRRFTGPDALIRPNLIVVGSSVLIQWENAIKEFTHLNCFVIGDFYRLQTFYSMYKSGNVRAYDIILLKNGDVTGNFVLPGEDPSRMRDHRPLISVIAKMTEQSCWSRVIYDDFDTISIPAGVGAINTLFTIYVSATNKKVEMPNKINVTTYKNIEEAIMSRPVILANVTSDKTLFTNFNVKNTADFTERSTHIPVIDGFRYVYANPDDNYMRLLGAMGEDDANNIMEMLNGDAIGTAADALGIKTTSVADIFRKMLDKKYERYIYDQDILAMLDVLKVDAQALDEHEDGKSHTGAELDVIRSAICKKTHPNMKFYSGALIRMLDDMTREFQEAKEQDGLAITRVIDNIKEGECQVCRLPLEEFDTFIVRCCGLIVCDECGIKGNQIQKRYDYKLKSTTICGSCANCKATIYPQTDLLFVDRNFDMEALLKAKGDEEPAEAIEEVVEVNDTKEPEIKNPKLKALLAIVRGQTPDECESIPISIQHLIAGRVDMPSEQTQNARKVVVFANFNETLNLIEEFLIEHGVTFLRLGGTFQEKANTVKKFMTFGQVLLINSSQHCAGLNIQFMTDLVFFHKIMDKNIEAQVAGRGQRIGRTCNLRIHYICYKNEKDKV